MVLTPMESILLAALLSVVFGGGAYWWARRDCVTQSECKERHAREALADVGHTRNIKLLFRMVRALVMYSNIPEAEKVNIINGKAEDE